MRAIARDVPQELEASVEELQLAGMLIDSAKGKAQHEPSSPRGRASSRLYRVLGLGLGHA